LFTSARAEQEVLEPENRLKWWLYFAGLWACINLASSGAALVSGSASEQSRALLFALLCATLLRAVAVVALLMWQRWGLYLYVLSALAYALLSTAAVQALPPLVGAAIMWVLVKRVWDRFQ
jgi:hypothetical protein